MLEAATNPKGGKWVAQTRVVAGSGDGGKGLDLRYIVKVEPIGFADGSFVEHGKEKGQG